LTTDTDEIIRCPSCGARDVRPSKVHGLIDTLFGALSRSPMRCRQCHKRFYLRNLKKDEDLEEDRTQVEDSDRN